MQEPSSYDNIQIAAAHINAIVGEALDGLTAPKKIVVCQNYPGTLASDALYYKVQPANNNAS